MKVMSQTNCTITALYKKEIEKNIIRHACYYQTLCVDPDFKEYVESYNAIYDSMPVCHYTTIGALEGIIVNNALLLSRLSQMNDIAEGNELFTKFEKYLKEIPDQNLSQVEEFIKSTKSEIKNCFAMSFSFNCDDSAQWDRYSDGGKGVCLVSSVKLLSSFFSKRKFFIIAPVQYAERDLCESFYRQYFKRIVGSNLSDSERKEQIVLGSLIKNSTFESESELRMLFLNEGVAEQTNNPNPEHKLKLDLSKFKEYQTSSLFSYLFPKIILGPCTDLKNCRLHDLFNDYHLNKNVVESCCTLKKHA